MKNDTINWNKVPDVITKEQFRQLCHIGKSTARYLLLSGKIPCVNTGKKTRCYAISKKDIMEYIVGREEWPEYYAASNGWYSKYADQTEILHLIPKISGDMHRYYAFLLKKCPDVLDVVAVSELTGYGRSTVVSWCSRNVLQHIFCRGKDLIPKKYLIDFFCSPSFRNIHRKSEWHLKILAAYPGWKHKKGSRQPRK